MTRINVLFLGPAREWAGVETTDLELADGATVDALRHRLLTVYPALRKAVSSIRFVVNEEFAGDDAVLRTGDRVALLPPVSGGSGNPDVLIDLVPGPIDLAAVRAFVCGRPELGGIVTFEGAVRAETSPIHGALRHLEYEAYASMARRQLARLADEARQRWSAGRVAVVHRLGIVPIGEASVVVAVACGHRVEAFEACRWIIEALKRDVPIWKKDVFVDGTTQWVTPPTPTDAV